MVKDMYTWDKVEIHLQTIMKKIEEIGQITNAVNLLKQDGLISTDYSNSFYIKRIYQLDRYKEIVRLRKEKSDFKKRHILQLRTEGNTYNVIADIVGVSYGYVQRICANREGYIKPPKKNKSINMSTKKAKEVVKYWNKYRYEGQVMREETKQAFELLGLKPE